MLNTLQDLGTVFLRIITIFPLLLTITFVLGKRAINEMPIFDYLIIITLASITGADLADPSVKHIPTIGAIILIVCLQRIVNHLMIRYRKFGRLITFEPTVVVYQGEIIKKSLKKWHYSIDNLLQMLRENGAFHIEEVEVAIIEANGSLSVHKRQSHNQTSDIQPSENLISFPVILEGFIYEDVLNYLGVSKAWLRQELLKKGVIRTDDVFVAAVDQNLQLTISTNNSSEHIPPFFH
ncbi:DUF421 domain-containing protein [Texcoconibacillus texcoconensis]|uniref:Uncharacterized membrane protein YcaP (DUF421 family) n=1 Tax=Texcoconibacillus texcoconensis TaxID=1095777 RepID=A0A840QNJ6_9BACI|nr:DUF421 domain-containing protein [Texcoconibacillus texcoconensis]MBB5172956.1 uncharacterized membrane protein YcaP (DUF421 family) [Texcoconibacillus texcoconensis]